MSKPSTSSFSAVITALRFPLIIMVVAIHLISDKLTLPQWGAPNWLYIYVSEFLSHSLPRIAVPMFFFISGYYAFYKKDWSQRSVWTVELKKRVKTLLIPYLLWNSIYLVILLAKTQVGLRLGVGGRGPPFPGGWFLTAPQLHSWLKALNIVRNICAHHGRLFNRVHTISPKLPAQGIHTDLDCINTDWKRTFGQLTLIQFLLDRFTVGNKKLLPTVVQSFPEVQIVPISHMGAPDNWQTASRLWSV